MDIEFLQEGTHESSSTRAGGSRVKYSIRLLLTPPALNDVAIRGRTEAPFQATCIASSFYEEVAYRQPRANDDNHR